MESALIVTEKLDTCSICNVQMLHTCLILHVVGIIYHSYTLLVTTSVRREDGGGSHAYLFFLS